MMHAMKKSITVLCILSFVACTDPGETTGVGAATGGVLGAGLGAIVGNQTGDAGSGLVIGAVAGAAAGGAVGNALQAQQEAIRTQDEAIERQEKTIRAQNSELKELRSLNSDGSKSSHGKKVVFPTREELNAKSPYGGKATHTSSSHLAKNQVSTRSEKYTASSSKSITSRTLVEDSGSTPKEKFGSYDWDRDHAKEKSSGVSEKHEVSASENSKTRESSHETARLATPHDTDSDECLSAEEEALKADKTPEVSERLFHYRRALRMCPGSPRFHNELGEVYLSLNRTADAEYEFQEALRSDPDFQPAKANLKALSKRNSGDSR